MTAPRPCLQSQIRFHSDVILTAAHVSSHPLATDCGLMLSCEETSLSDDDSTAGSAVREVQCSVLSDVCIPLKCTHCPNTYQQAFRNGLTNICRPFIIFIYYASINQSNVICVVHVHKSHILSLNLNKSEDKRTKQPFHYRKKLKNVENSEQATCEGSLSQVRYHHVLIFCL